MSRLRRTLAAAALSLATLAPASYANAADLPVKAAKAAPEMPFFFVIDDRVTFSYIFHRGPDPACGRLIRTARSTPRRRRQVYSFHPLRRWAYGTNFFTISLFKSDQNDVAGPWHAGRGHRVSPAGFWPLLPAGCTGASEIYGLFRSTFGWNEIFNTKAFTMGPLHKHLVRKWVWMPHPRTDISVRPNATLLRVCSLPLICLTRATSTLTPLVYWEFANHNSFAQCGAGWTVSNVPGVTCLAKRQHQLQADLGNRDQLLHGPGIPAREHCSTSRSAAVPAGTARRAPIPNRYRFFRRIKCSTPRSQLTPSRSV